MEPVLQHIINVSPMEGHFSNELMKALLRPLLKKISLDLTKKKYRPVSNLSYISKLIEWEVFNQLTSIAAQSGNVEELQSAYGKHHSTETAILKVKSDLLTAMDYKEVTCLILLDLTAAFDTLNLKTSTQQTEI